MNSVDRIMATVQGNPVDRRAVAPVLSIYGSKLTCCPTEEYFSRSQAYVDGQLAVFDTFSPDVIFGPFCVAKEGEVFNGEVEYFTNLPPNLVRPGMSHVSEITDLAVDNLLSHPFVEYIEQAIGGLIKTIGSKAAIAPIMLSPVDLPLMIMGLERWLQIFLFDPQEAEQLITWAEPYFVQRCNRLFDLGAPFIIIPGSFVNPSILTREIVETFAIPLLKQSFQQLTGPVILHSGGAKLLPFIDLFSSLEQVAGFVLNPGEDMRSARAKLQSSAVLDGNIDGPNLHTMSSDEVYCACHDILSQTNNDPYVILGTSAADVRPETPMKNIQQMLRAAKEHGGCCG